MSACPELFQNDDRVLSSHLHNIDPFRDTFHTFFNNYKNIIFNEPNKKNPVTKKVETKKTLLNYQIMKTYLKYALMSVLAFGIISCDDDDNSSERGEARMAVRLTDAPGDYDAVFINAMQLIY